MEGETANYVVLNVNEILQQLLDLNPLGISAYGYWGVPSDTAVTPYEKYAFQLSPSSKGNPLKIDLLILTWIFQKIFVKF